MQINVTGRHLDVTEAIRDYCVGKLQNVLVDVPRISNVHVILSVEKHRHEAEVVLQALHHTVEAKAESDNLYASIDGMVDKVERQLGKLRDKVTDHKLQAKLGEIEARDAGGTPPPEAGR